MRKISMILPVYNEGVLLNYSLKNTIPYVDEVVIVDSSPNGASTDETKSIIDAYSTLYPKKIKYFSGTFRLENGAWDESAARNLALDNCTGELIIPHCGDMFYTEQDFIRIMEIVDKYDMQIYYCLFVEFWLDHTKIRLYKGHAMEAWCPVLAVSDFPIINRNIIDKYVNGPHLILSGYDERHSMFMPNVFRYHFGWITGFEKQVQKHYRNVTMRQWGEQGEELLKLSEGELINWAIHHVLDYPLYPCGYDYCGIYPLPFKMSYLDGYEDIINKYKLMYGSAIDV